MHAYPEPETLDSHPDYDLEEDVTIVQPSPHLALLAREMDEAVTSPTAAALVESETFLGMGYPSAPTALDPSQTHLAMGYPSTPAPVRHTFTEPLRGYPQAAAYVPRHEETAVFLQAAQPGLLAAPSAGQSAAPAPEYGANVAALPSIAHDGSKPLTATGSSIAYAAAAPSVAPEAALASHAPTAHRKADGARRQIRAGWALFGALLGAIAGSLLWGAVGHLTGGYEFKYGAVLIGLLTGAGAAGLGGGHTKGIGALGAIFGLAGVLTGKVLFEILVQPHLSLADHIAYHTTAIDLIFYGATIVAGFAVGAGALSPRTILARARRVLGHYLPAIG